MGGELRPYEVAFMRAMFLISVIAGLAEYLTWQWLNNGMDASPGHRPLQRRNFKNSLAR